MNTTTTLTRYSDFAPTCFDRKGAFLTGYDATHPDRQNWLIVPVTRDRDNESDPGVASNWDAALEILDEDSPNVEVHSFRHWGPGWFELILIKPDTPEAELAEKIARALDSYPLLNDEDYSLREYEAICETWDTMSLADRWYAIERESSWHREGVSVFAVRRTSPFDVGVGGDWPYCLIRA